VLAAGAVSAFASTLLSASALRRRPGGRALLPWSAYRGALALVVIGRLRRAQNRGR
jgi:hypothetical protein